MRDTSYLKTLVELFRTLYSEVQAAVAEGASLDDIHRKVTLADFESRFAHYASTDLMRLSGFRSFLAPAVDRAYQEATGHLKPENQE